ncbi:hypothetical protein LJC27_01940 [Christensenellaceae bacterium OttesenSCG-928-M15]|nr:hypothetical protein [Christensenellaceae bacterium OttesenSCG-928-M15]
MTVYDFTSNAQDGMSMGTFVEIMQDLIMDYHKALAAHGVPSNAKIPYPELEAAFYDTELTKEDGEYWLEVDPAVDPLILKYGNTQSDDDWTREEEIEGTMLEMIEESEYIEAREQSLE